ncbi:MAG: isoprenylcysteine carboxylmethyltransferase family protein [Clostridia bacterium]|nr:isoprenylcysteine carboxylmethyltransferase family protein [Clostridia bacterium]
MKLWQNAMIKYMSGLVMIGLLLFIPAGTLAYAGGWRFIALLFVPMLILGITLLIKSPQLLAKRLSAKEKQTAQKGIVAAAGMIFVLAFVLAGLDFRYAWTNVPMWLIWLSSAVMLLSYGMYAEVMRENAYLSRTVEIQRGQKVIDTGLYAIVRHPMYTSTVLLFLAMPLVLGSWVSFCVMLLYPAAIVFRIVNEEKVLEEGLEGYGEYKKRVKYRLIPFIW